MPKYWNNETITVQKTPEKLIREAAIELEGGTEGNLKLVIQDQSEPQRANRKTIEIHAPSLEYARELFQLHYDRGELVYPCILRASEPVFGGNSSVLRCNNQAEFDTGLTQLLNSQYVKATVASLLAKIHDSPE